MRAFRTFVSRLSHKLTPAASPVARAATAAVESLEGRTLFAAALPAGFQLSKLVTVPGNATAMTIAPDGRIFLTHHDGKVSVISKAGVTASTPVVTVPLSSAPSSGAYGIALDPGFSTNGYFYVLYTATKRPGSTAVAENRVGRFTLDPVNPNRALPGSERIIVDEMYSEMGGHNGGGLAFGADGKLYVASGEGSGELAPDSAGYAQDLNRLAGKILRVNKDGTVPTDNPYYGQAGKRGEIWAYGFRNPFTIATRPGTSTLFVNDVQSDEFEEVNHVQKGRNYGWPAQEGFGSNPAYANPLYAYAHTDSIDGKSAAVTGGAFYTKTQFPASYQGKYFFADYINKFIRVLDPATGQATSFGTGLPGFLDLDQAADGSLYGLAPFGGQIARISYVGGVANRNPTAEAAADVTAGPAPLTVHFSGDGSADQDGDPLTYAWDFGDGTAGAGKNVSHTYAGAGTFNAVLTVTDGNGGSAAADPIRVRPGTNAPVVSIALPGPGLKYVAGQTFDFAGSATDVEDGDLPASALEWAVVFHHATHTHPFLESVPGVASGSFTVPAANEVAPDQWYRVHLKATDSSGVMTEVTRDVHPTLSTNTLRTNVAGLKLNLDDQPQTLPMTFTGVVGQTRKLTAPASQVVGGVTYDFTGWADGATAASRLVQTPAADTTYQANYTARGNPPPTTAGVTGFSLMNADTEQKIATLFNVATVNLSATPRISVRADISGTVGSVVFKLNGAVIRTESMAPFATANNGVGTYDPWPVAVGSHTLVATAYAQAGGQGAALRSATVSFTVTRSTTPTAVPTVTAFTLINATTDKVVKTLTSGTTISRSTLPKFTVGVNVANAPGSIVFKLNGAVVKKESFAPFAMSNNGVTNGVPFYDPWAIAPGSYTLVATPYTQKDGLGTAGKSLTVSFKIV